MTRTNRESMIIFVAVRFDPGRKGYFFARRGSGTREGRSGIKMANESVYLNYTYNINILEDCVLENNV